MKIPEINNLESVY